jgi:hypothetical protein
MKKHLVAAIFLTLASLAFAEVPITVNKEIVCTTPSIVFSAVRSMFGEQPIWHGNAEGEGSIVITANTTTNSWSIIQYNEKIACVLEVGKGFQFRDTKKLKL